MAVRTRMLLAALVCSTDIGAAQHKVSADAFLLMPAEKLGTTAVRIEYQGPRNEALPALVFTVAGHRVDWNAFRSVQDVRIEDYEVKWRGDRPSFEVTLEDLKTFLRSLEAVTKQESLRTKPLSNALPWISVVVVSGRQASYSGFAESLSREQAGEFFILMRQALRADPKDISIMNGGANVEAMRALQSFGCALALLPESIPAKDVTAQVTVSRGGLRFNGQERRFESTITVTNTSSLPIRPPISLVVQFSSGATLMNAHGRTCVTKPVGREFITLPLPGTAFKPHEALETTLVFSAGESEAIEFSTRVLATPGER